MKNALLVGSKRYYPAPALEKGLDILELLASNAQGMTASEVARRLNRTVPEIFRMLLCLVHRGYLAQTEARDQYHLRLQLFRMTQEHVSTKHMVMEALPIMQRVAHVTRQSCHLGVLDGGHVVILAQADSPEPMGFYVKVGSKMDLMGTATGHVILAHQTGGAPERTIQEWEAKTKKKKPAELDNHLAKIRERGYERFASYRAAGVTDISFPVFNAHGMAIAGLTVPYVKRIGNTITVSKIVAALRTASCDIGEALWAMSEGNASRISKFRK